MNLMIEAELVPLIKTDDGVLMVGETRVPIDTVVFSFNEGASPEEIVLRYTTLELADVYAVIAYYLKHKAEIESYLREREERAARVREENERRFPQAGIRERLLARRKQREG